MNYLLSGLRFGRLTPFAIADHSGGEMSTPPVPKVPCLDETGFRSADGRVDSDRTLDAELV